MQRISTVVALTLAACAADARDPGAWPGESAPPGYQQNLNKQLANVEAKAKRGPFRPEWQSLQGYREPDWFRDAKFGVFLHWGVYSVPAFANEWYSRNMYVHGSPAYAYHRAVFGPQAQFGYKDFVPQFKAEKFDANGWVDLFKRAGMRYVVPVAEHCDGFAMYDSQFTSWDAAEKGPKRDIVGELEKSARAQGLHFGVSSHRAEHWWWYNEGTKYESDVNDPANAGLYGPAAPRTLPADSAFVEPNPSHLERWLPPSRAFLDDWLARTTELMDKYQPEFIYFDWWISQPQFEPYLQKAASYYYNQAAANKQGVVITYKQEAFAPGSAVLDIERGKLDSMRLRPWQSDTSVSIGSWGYVNDDRYRTARSLLADLIDVVSKNGNLLLNVGPRADGTIAQEIQDVLLQMGGWLKTNGEAIYGTRPWVMYGEGPTNVTVGEKKEEVNASYTPADLRFTAKDGALYVMGFVRPQNTPVLIKTLYAGNPYIDRGIASITLLGAATQLTYRQTPKGLEVQLPAAQDDLPYAIRIEVKK